MERKLARKDEAVESKQDDVDLLEAQHGDLEVLTEEVQQRVAQWRDCRTWSTGWSSAWSARTMHCRPRRGSWSSRA